jgi:hypothetical protein
MIPQPSQSISSNKIHYLDIGIDSNTDMIRWAPISQTVFRLDILAARATARETHFLRLEKSGSRTVFRKKNGLTFVIAADESVQFQLLEAILDEVMSQFFEIYGSICCDILTGMTNMFEGFQFKIPEIIAYVENEKVVWVRAECKVCSENHKVCIRRSLIQKAKDYPVSIVFMHLGHGLLLYIDANFRVRGAELVDITG